MRTIFKFAKDCIEIILIFIAGCIVLFLDFIFSFFRKPDY